MKYCVETVTTNGTKVSIDHRPCAVMHVYACMQPVRMPHVSCTIAEEALRASQTRKCEESSSEEEATTPSQT